ncbi:MAG: heavy metal translocating P-type ATPase metal-binding domain-containing protein [Crocinitomicaceae bacterium]
MQNCAHCNSDCTTEVYLDDKVFCCQGCKTVFEILQDADMSKYYDLNSSPGKKQDGGNENFSYLELNEIQEKLLLFQEGDVAKIQVVLPQIHCSSCLWLLENLDKLHEGVINCQVNFVSKRADILFNTAEISLRHLAELLQRIGYRPEFNLDEDSSKERKVTDGNKKTIFKIGVVGFCFGNIMLFSFPEYLGIDVNFESFQKSFNWLNLVLSLPVLIFGASPFLSSALTALRNKTINIDVPISLGIIALFFRSVFEIVMGHGAGYFDSFAGLIFFLLIGRWFQQKTYAAINFERDFKSYFPVAVTRKIANSHETITLENVQVGDEIIIRSGELIPADAELRAGEANIDYSFVSGESTLIKKEIGDKLFAGGRQKGSSLTIKILKSVDNSYLTKLWNSPVFHEKKKESNFSDVVSKYFTISLIVISAVAGIVWFQINPSKVAFIVTSVLIVACPCAIALAIPFTYGNAIRILGEKKAYLRSSEVLGDMQTLTDVVFDKTGTLTSNNGKRVEWEGEVLSNYDLSVVRSIVFQSSHVLSKQLYSYLTLKNSEQLLVVSAFSEEIGEGVQAEVNNRKWFVGKSKEPNLDPLLNASVVAIYRDDKYLGRFIFKSEYRSGIEAMIQKLKLKYNVHLLSGDNDSEKEYFKRYFLDENIHFNQLPEDKLNYIKMLQDKGRKVMMLGDGLNDSGALMKAEVGVAVAEDVHAFSPSSDLIIQGGKLSVIDRFILFSRRSKQVVIVSYIFSLLYNFVGLYFALTGQLTPLVAAVLMPISSISTVLLVTFLVRIWAKRLL